MLSTVCSGVTLQKPLTQTTVIQILMDDSVRELVVKVHGLQLKVSEAGLNGRYGSDTSRPGNSG